MADAQRTIDLIFNGVDKTGAATLGALNNVKSLSGSVQGLTQPISDFSTKALQLEAGLLAAGAAMAVFAVKTAGDFEQSFAQISTLFDASDADLKTFKDNIQAYAATSGKSTDDIMKSLAAAIGSGVDWTQSLDLIATAEKLAIATKADLKGTTEVLVSTMNAYGIATKDAGGLSDLLFQIIKDGKIEMTDLAQSLAMVTPVAAAAGVDIKEVGAAIATLTAAGIAPSTAIEYLRSTISNIIKPSKEASDMAAKLGISFDANTLKSKGLAAVLDDVAKATGGNSGMMAKLIGDVGGLVAAMVLTGPQADKFKDTIKSMGDSAGSVAEAYEKMAGSLENIKQRVLNAFTGMLTAVGTPLLDEFGGIADAIAQIFLALGASVKDGALKDLVAYVETQFGSIQKALETVATNLPAALDKADFGGFTKGVDAVVNAFSKLFGGIDITTVDGLTKAIELAGAAFLGLSQFTAGVIDAFKPLFNELVALSSNVDGLSPGFFSLAGNIGGAAMQLNVLAGAIGGMVPWIEALVGLLVAKQGLSLMGALVSLTGTLPLLTPAITAVGVAITTYLAADKLVKLVDALNQWKTATDHLATSQKASTQLTDKAVTTLDKFAQTTGIVVKSIDEADALVTSGAVVWSNAVNGWVKADDALTNVAKAADDVVNPFEAANNAMLANADAAGKTTDTATKLAAAQKEVAQYSLENVPIIDSLTGKVTGYEQQLVKSATGTIKLGDVSKATGTELDKIAKSTKEAEEAQRKWTEAQEKMSFETKLKLIDSQTKITTANIEADAKKMVAAFDSLSGSIKSTGDVLAVLFGALKDSSTMDWSTLRKIDDQIAIENKHRQDAFDLQKRLIEAQINLMKQQSNALTNGEGLIKIDGAGLKPHLEAFMWEILSAIQTRVNKDGMKMLLGM